MQNLAKKHVHTTAAIGNSCFPLFSMNVWKELIKAKSPGTRMPYQEKKTMTMTIWNTVTELACQEATRLLDFILTQCCTFACPIWPKSPKVSAKLCGCRRGEGCGLRWCRVLFELWETTVPQGTAGAVDGDQYWERFMPALMMMVVISCCSLWWSCWWGWWWWWWWWWWWRWWWWWWWWWCCLWSWFSPLGLDHPSPTVTIQSLLSTGKSMGSTSCTTVGSMPSWCCGGGAASAFCVLCWALLV